MLSAGWGDSIVVGEIGAVVLITTFVLRRIFAMVPTLFVAVTLVFIGIRVAPGDPARAVLGDYASKAAVDMLRERMGLNKPLITQYWEYIVGLLHGDFGKSLINGRPMGQQLAQTAPYTVGLTVSSAVVGLSIGLAAGIVSAVRRNRFADQLIRIMSLAGVSIPSFYLGILLMLVFSVQLEWLPALGGGRRNDLADMLRHLVLPTVTLGLITASYVTRLARSAVLNIVTEDYVRTAKAKGVGALAIVNKHIVRNALVPIIAVGGIYVVLLLGGSVVVEVVFARPGLGRLMVGSMLQRDYVAVQSVIVVYAVAVAVVNVLVEVGYGLADPRIRYV